MSAAREPGAAWTECVPNFSTGRDPALLAELVRRVDAVADACVLDAGHDADHNRAVLTIAARGPAVVEAALAAARVATERIDLRRHTGVHPRMGATDVVPFVPLAGLSPGLAGAELAACVTYAHAFGARLADELRVPAFYYGAAARIPEREALPAVRRMGVRFLEEGGAPGEGPDPVPDIGPDAPHPTAGSTAVGARAFLVAFNLELASDDLALARSIAREVRASSGGLPGIRALGLALASTGTVQVSTNVCDFRRTGLVALFDAVERRAREAGTRVRASELIGLAPAAALDAGIAEHVRLPEFDPERHVLERRLAHVLDRDRA